MGAVDLKSMEGNSRIWPANGWSSSSVHGVGRERESELRESDGVGAGWVEEDGLAFNAAYGVAGEGSMAGTWRRPMILGHGVDETECVADRPPSQADRPQGWALHHPTP